MNLLNKCPQCHNQRLWTVKENAHRRFFAKYFIECPFCHFCGPARVGKRRAEKAWDKATKTYKSARDTQPVCMSLEQVIAYMRYNPYAKVKHELFADDEFLYMAVDGLIYDENDYMFESWETGGPDGIRIRQEEYWQRDRSV